MAATETSPPPGAPLPLANCYWVVPGRLLAGEYPGGATPEATRERLKRLTAAGIVAFVDLTEPGELLPYEAELPPGVLHLRCPVPDHGLPDARSQMAAILASLRRALDSPGTVYLHCKAGIGRTGMVAGCFLAEQGLGGEGALEELNRLWQQCGRSALWPSVPETAEQVEYVRRWRAPARAEADPLLEPATLAAARGLRARFLGALLGLALGDALAAATQFKRPGRFVPVGDLIGGGPFDLPRGAWSDDTAMALCLADSLLERGGSDARDQVERYVRWQQQGYLSATGQCVGITAGTARALALAQRRRQQVVFGLHDPQALEPEPLSRVAPVVMYFFADAGAGEEQAAQAVRTTCEGPAALSAGRALARALHAALAGRPRAEIVASAAVAPPAGRAAYAAADATAPAALEAALETLASTGSFRDALLTAANLGGNSDVIASITGALAGAHYSVSAIPALWRNSLMKQGLIEGFADRLLAHALVELSG